MLDGAAATLLSLLCWIVCSSLEQGSALGQGPCSIEAETLLLLAAPSRGCCHLVQVRTGSDPAGSATLASLRHRQHLEARAAEEEDMFARVPLSREDRRRLKADTRAGLAGQGAMLDDFADDVAGLVQVGHCCTATSLADAIFLEPMACKAAPHIQRDQGRLGRSSARPLPSTWQLCPDHTANQLFAEQLFRVQCESDTAGVQVAEGSQNGGVDNSFLRHQASQRFGADLQGQQARTLQSGDDDLAPRLQLAERRSKMDSIRAKAAARWAFWGCCRAVLWMRCQVGRMF